MDVLYSGQCSSILEKTLKNSPISSSEGFDGPIIRDGSPRIPKNSDDASDTWAQTAISPRNYPP